MSPADNGARFRAIATNAAGSATSAEATLTVVAGGATSATFIGTDTTTKGTWRGVYGVDGYHVIGDAASHPAYAKVTPSGQSAWTWASSTSDVRALQAATGTNRVAATWYGGVFNVDINLVDGAAHQVGVYVVDWDAANRSERLEVRDATSDALLDSRTVTGFQGGQDLRWNISGHVKLRVVNVGGANAVISGLFFESGSSNPPPVVALTAPAEGSAARRRPRLRSPRPRPIATASSVSSSIEAPRKGNRR